MKENVVIALLPGFRSLNRQYFQDSLVSYNAESKELALISTKIPGSGLFTVKSDEAKRLIQDEIPYKVAFEERKDYWDR